jgi:hypothetical protein
MQCALAALLISTGCITDFYLTIINKKAADSHLFCSSQSAILYMILVIIMMLIVLLVSWLLFSAIELKMDTRIPVVSIQWISIGKAKLQYENESWWLDLRILFFHRKWMMEKLLTGNSSNKKTQQPSKKKSGKKNKKLLFKQIISILKSCRVVEFKIALDTGDNIKNAWLYPLNFYRYSSSHLVFINFIDENYLMLTVRNVPWRIIGAWIK